MKYKNPIKAILCCLVFSSSASCMIFFEEVRELAKIETDPTDLTSFLLLIPKGERIKFFLELINWENKSLPSIPTNGNLENIIPKFMIDNDLTLIPKARYLHKSWNYHNTGMLLNNIVYMTKKYTINGTYKCHNHLSNYLYVNPPNVNKNGLDLVNYAEEYKNLMSNVKYKSKKYKVDPSFLLHANQPVRGQLLLWNIVKYYIRDGYFNVNYQDPEKGKTVLMRESFFGNADSVKFLVCLVPYNENNGQHLMNLKSKKGHGFHFYAKWGRQSALKLLDDANKRCELNGTKASCQNWAISCDQIVNPGKYRKQTP